MDLIEISLSVEFLPTKLTSMFDSLTFYLTCNRYYDSIGVITMNPKYDEGLPKFSKNMSLKPVLKRKTSVVDTTSPKKVSVCSFG